MGRGADGRFHSRLRHGCVPSLGRQGGREMAAQGGQPPFFHATAGRRLEPLLRRPLGSERDRQRLSGVEAGRRAGDRPAHVESAGDGLDPGRLAADEHVFQALPRAARAIPLGLRADHSVRSHAHRQMVSREFLGDEFVDSLDARPALDHQPFQTDAPSEQHPHHAR